MERDELAAVGAVLESGGIAVFPTDTTWGIGCDVTNEAGIERIWEIKQCKKERSIVVLVSSIEMLKQYAKPLHPKIETLLAYHERPVTVLYDAVEGLPELLKNQEGFIAIRLVKDPFCSQLINALGRPLAVSSANLFGESYPENFGQISSEILSNADYVVKVRQTGQESDAPSMWIKMSSKGELIFLRR
jgi:L-threonylcarbamoyladenylate synthase